MSNNLRVALVGAAGRMGQAIVDVAKSEGVEVVARIDLGDQLVFADGDVTIDFSHADTTASICEVAIKSKTPLVIGTTGHSAKQRDDIVAASKRIPVVLASNFSVGVNASRGQPGNVRARRNPRSALGDRKIAGPL